VEIVKFFPFGSVEPVGSVTVKGQVYADSYLKESDPEIISHPMKCTVTAYEMSPIVNE